MCGPVQLKGVTVLSIGKVSVLPNNAKGKGQSEKGKKGKGHGKKGKGDEKMQPVYLGDDEGRVICTLASNNNVNQIASKLRQNAYVDISPLKIKPGQAGLLYWTENTEMTLLERASSFTFPYDVNSDYAKDFVSMAFARDCIVGSYVAIAMRIMESEQKWTAQNEPYLQIAGFDTARGDVGPLRLWQYEESDIHPGHAYILRGLKVVYDRTWDATRHKYVRTDDLPKTIECNLRTACEHVEGIQSITEYL